MVKILRTKATRLFFSARRKNKLNLEQDQKIQKGLERRISDRNSGRGCTKKAFLQLYHNSHSLDVKILQLFQKP